MPGKTWKITGYIGFSDYDGPKDDNLTTYIVFDERFSKKAVIDFMVYFFSKKYRTVVINADEKID